MDARADKNRLIERMRIERARWDMLLVQVDVGRMSVPGVEGRLSMRDIIADVVKQEKWVAGRLRHDALGELDTEEMGEGEKAEEHSPSITVRELMDESRRAFEQIMRIVMGLPAEDLFRPQPFEWTGGKPVGAAIPAYTVEYYQRHYGPIRRWMTKRRRRARR